MEENIEELQRYVPNVHFEQIPIKNLVSDQNYQRNLSLRHVEKAATNFDLYQINPVKVSRRNGINYVFNGQHTIEIVALVSGSRETPVWCMIYDDLNYTQEADIFANQMKYVKPLLPYEIFMANIEAGSEKELIIKDLVESYHLSITSSSHPGGICAVSTLVNIYDKYGFHTLDRVLRLCVATWEGAPMSFSSNMLNAVARLDNAFGDKMNDTTFKEKVKAILRNEEGLTMEQYNELKNLIEKQAAAISALQAENKELKAVVQSTMVYDYNDGNMPSWARTAVQAAQDYGALVGDEQGRLGLSYKDLRTICREYRCGMYDK